MKKNERRRSDTKTTNEEEERRRGRGGRRGGWDYTYDNKYNKSSCLLLYTCFVVGQTNKKGRTFVLLLYLIMGKWENRKRRTVKELEFPHIKRVGL
jgi:hypothetical protein